ncbi:hypothetical protein EJ06DRAFT_428550 [Trichodelitschia bisporula]|uniref:Uncharacterized protein n=1 Tax=Trichodelitschia bisporula TaxID=703511 RepID=A0A6G1HWJ5_9PEZI|nr:hypothetical protein EJ06DRAFT_428550 [Trichodelitschia bisporula]
MRTKKGYLKEVLWLDEGFHGVLIIVFFELCLNMLSAIPIHHTNFNCLNTPLTMTLLFVMLVMWC